MRKIVPITDLQRQAGQIIAGLTDSNEPVIITQRGRAAAVIVSSDRYAEIEEDLTRLDELELIEMVEQARQARAEGEMLPHDEVKARIERQHSGSSKEPRVKRTSGRKR